VNLVIVFGKPQTPIGTYLTPFITWGGIAMDLRVENRLVKKEKRREPDEVTAVFHSL